MKEVMKIIPRTLHGILDYVVGVLLIAAPWILGFADNGPATYVPVILGAGALVYSLLTNYERGLVRVIPFSTHLVLDVLSGAFLALSPWLLGFADRVYLPHLIVGLFEIAAGLMTRNAPDYSDTVARRSAR